MFYIIPKRDKLLAAPITPKEEVKTAPTAIKTKPEAPTKPEKLKIKPKGTVKTEKIQKEMEPKKKKEQAGVAGTVPFDEAKHKEELAKTEEELDVKKPEIKCIVHRGVITGNVYICHQCQSFYCDRCAKVLKLKGEKCWYCGNDIDVAVSDQEKLRYLEKKAIDIIEDMIDELPGIKKYIESNQMISDSPEVREYIFSIISPEELDKIDLLELTIDEKKEFIKEIINLDPEERKQLIANMLESRG